jgi:hypothetical protein
MEKPVNNYKHLLGTELYCTSLKGEQVHGYVGAIDPEKGITILDMEDSRERICLSKDIIEIFPYIPNIEILYHQAFDYMTSQIELGGEVSHM